MSTGVNVEKVNKLRQELMDYIEKMNGIFNRLDIECASVQNSISGTSKDIITKKCTDIRNSYPTIKTNIMTYIDDLGKVTSGYEQLVEEVSEKIISDMDKITERSVY